MRMTSTLSSISLSCLLALVIGAPLSAQSPPEAEVEIAPEADPTDPSNLRPLSQDDSILSFEGGQRLMNEAEEAITQENYDLAQQKLQDARRLFNQLSNFHQQIASSFQGIDGRISEDQRRQAIQAAQRRDEATYQLALVHRAQDEPELAVPLLIQVVRSQNPTTELGTKAYQQLFELGFVEFPFPSGDRVTPPASRQESESPQG